VVAFFSVWLSFHPLEKQLAISARKRGAILRKPAASLSFEDVAQQFSLAPLKLDSACPKLASLDWTVRHLSKKLGRLKVEAQHAPDLHFTVVKRSAIDGRSVLRHASCQLMRFDRFVEQARSCCWAIAQLRVAEGMSIIPDLQKLPGIVEYLNRKEGKEVSTRIWMAPDGKVSSLHFDESDSILWQASGSKLVRLVSPKENRRMYPGFLPVELLHHHNNGSWTQERCPCKNFDTVSSHNFSPVNLSALDIGLHPLAAESTVFEVELFPGDALLIPARWWHEVVNQAKEEHASNDTPALNVAVSIWKTPESSRLKRRSYMM